MPLMTNIFNLMLSLLKNLETILSVFRNFKTILITTVCYWVNNHKNLELYSILLRYTQ